MFEAGILILSILIGSLAGYFLGSNRSLTKFLLTFSGAFFLGIAVLEIFPHVYESHELSIGLWVLGGLFFQMLTETLSKGVEHGHMHTNGKGSIPTGIFIGLAIHSFFETLPVMNQPNHSLLWAIFIHNIPISMVLFSSLVLSGTSLKKSLLYMSVFALAGPLGLLAGESVLGEFHHQALAFVAGIFIHIATVILFESSDSHKFKAQKILSVLLGFGIAYITVLLGH